MNYTCGLLVKLNGTMGAKSEVIFAKISRCSQMKPFDILYQMNECVSVFYTSKESKFFWGPPKVLFSLKQQQKTEFW